MRGRLAWLLVAAACNRSADDGEPSRARVLAKLPAASIAVLAADGHALVQPRFHAVIDALRPEIPSSLDCVVDAALGSEHVAIALTRERGVVVALDTHLPVKCHALSRIDDVWVATLGASAGGSGSDTVLATPELVRARPYLLSAPVALVAATALGDVLLTAQPDPFDAWLAIDTTDALAAPAEAALRERIAQLAKDPATAPFAPAIAVHRDGHQIVAELHGAPSDVAIAVRKLVRDPRKPSSSAFVCPSPHPPGIRCAGGTRFEATRLAAVFDALRAARVATHVNAAEVTGMRLAEPVPELGLEKGDVIAGIGGRTVTSLDAFRTLLAEPKATTFVIRRGTTEALLSLTELKP
jgi:hypothetical protein